MQTTTNTTEETYKLGFDLGQKNKNKKTIIALEGDLGAGKTTFTQGFAKGLGIDQKIVSPTFIIIRQYPLPQTEMLFYHIDLYRLNEPIDLLQIGLKEIFELPNSIALIEWSEKIKDLLPKDTIKISIKITNPNSRQIYINNISPD